MKHILRATIGDDRTGFLDDDHDEREYRPGPARLGLDRSYRSYRSVGIGGPASAARHHDDLHLRNRRHENPLAPARDEAMDAKAACDDERLSPLTSNATRAPRAGIDT